MKASITGVGVFSSAIWTEWKHGQGGAVAIVGKGIGDGETRSAVGTGEKWIGMTAIPWIQQFAAALGTRCQIGGQRGTAGTG
jgi:hypothetical protein